MNTVLQSASTHYQDEASDHLKQRIADQFGEAAIHYDDKALIQREIAEFALSVLAQQQTNKNRLSHALDIGCGTGAYTHRLLEFATNVVGVDLAQGMINYARTHHSQGGIRWAVSDAEALSLNDASVELIYSSMALQWLSGPEKVAAECHRVLSEGGRGTIAVVVDGSLNEIDSTWQALQLQSPVNRFLSVAQWVKAFTHVGFEIQVQQQRFTSWHDNVFAVLHSIKDIGAGVVTLPTQQNRLNKSRLTTLNSLYQERFGERDKLPLSWQIAFISFRKSQPETKA